MRPSPAFWTKPVDVSTVQPPAGGPPPPTGHTASGSAPTPGRTTDAPPSADGGAKVPKATTQPAQGAPAAATRPAVSVTTNTPTAGLQQTQATPSLPANLQALPPGALLAGAVVPHPSGQGAVLATTEGLLTFDTDIDLPPGSRVTLQIHSNGARLAATVVAVDGRPPAPAAPAAVVLSALIDPAAVQSGTARTTAPLTPSGAATGPIAPATFPPQHSVPQPASQSSANPTSLMPDIGARLTGTVALQPNDGRLILDTNSGRFQLATPQPLQTGSRLTIDIRSAAPRLLAAILRIDGRPISGPLPQIALAPADSDLTAQPLHRRSFAAKVVETSPAANVSKAVPSAFRIADGAQVTVRTDGPGSATPTPSTGRENLTNLVAQTTPRPATAIPATVVGHDKSIGLVVATSTGQNVRLAGAPALPNGTSVWLVPDQAAGLARPPASPSHLPAMQSPSPRAAAEFAATLDAAAAEVPTITNRLAGGATSALTPNSVVNLISYVFGLRAGDVRPWLGDRALRALEQAGRGDLITKLADTGDKAGRLLTEAPTSEWRHMSLPISDGQDARHIWLHLGPDPENRDSRDEDTDKDGTRMLVDVTLSRFGRLQFDGRYARAHFSLIVRSEQALDKTVRAGISEIFMTMRDTTGLEGQVTFQVSSQLASILPVDAPPLSIDDDRVVV